MRGVLRLARSFSSKKLGIADTAKVIQEKIMNITQVVHLPLLRTMSRNSVLSSALETVLLELSASTRFRQEKWLSSDQVSEAWLSILKLTMLVSSSSEMIGNPSSIQINSGGRHCYQNRRHRRRPHRRGNVGSRV